MPLFKPWKVTREAERQRRSPAVFSAEICGGSSWYTHLVVHRMMGTVWVERQRKPALFCQDTREPEKEGRTDTHSREYDCCTHGPNYSIEI